MISYRESSREDYMQDRNFSGHRSRMRQLCSQTRREEKRRDSDISRSESRSRSRSSSRVSNDRDRIRCYKCREYDQFADNCPNSVSNENSDCDDPNQSTLQMLAQVSPVGSEMHESIDYLNM